MPREHYSTLTPWSGKGPQSNGSANTLAVTFLVQVPIIYVLFLTQLTLNSAAQAEH